MAKIVIRNRVESGWKPVIEAKLQLMLGSMLAYINRIEIDLERAVQSKDRPTAYACKLLLVEDNGERYMLCNEQPDAELAIEGAIARARRTMARRCRARSPGWRQASAQ